MTLRYPKQLLLLLSISVIALTARASTEDLSGMSAHEVVNSTTSRIMTIIEEAQEYVDEDPQRYYEAVHEVLDPVVDFRGFARGVMGEYATSSRYRSLDEDGRAQLRDQLDRFTETMREGLIKTYSKGLLVLGGSRIELSDPGEDDAQDRRATVRQMIYSTDSEPYIVVYQMAKDGDAGWQLRNLIVQDVNLGKIYRSQFEAAARKYDGDLDRVIANWSAETAEESLDG